MTKIITKGGHVFNFPEICCLQLCTVYADERDRCKQCNNFIPVIVRALFSMAMDRGCYNAAINKISTSADENFLFGGILNTGNSFALSGPELAEWVRLGMPHENPSRRMTKVLPSI
jgi:hypothetical protein